VTGAWVTGLEVAVAPGELITLGGAARKDVAGYDLRSLLVGSEGTLGIVTAAWLRLIPAPEAELPVVAFYPDVETGCAAVTAAMSSGVAPSVIEFLDAGALQAALGAFPGQVSGAARFALIVSADGSVSEAGRQRSELCEAVGDGAAGLHVPTGGRAIAELWRWRSGVSTAVTAERGGKVSEDIAVPVDRLAEAILATQEIGRRHGLPACSWGHAGDGNLHSTFEINPAEPAERRRAEAAAQELFRLATELGGTVSGEHGLGLVKRGALAGQWAPAAVHAHEGIKDLLDPKGLLNPGKKVARAGGG
jgi:FAD/FMN-containing dehydrogenase